MTDVSGGSEANWPTIEGDLPVVLDPNYCAEAVASCPTHGVCPPCREGWGHWDGHQYVPTIESERGDADGPFVMKTPPSQRRHWHLWTRHVHPDWHGHCDPSKRGYKRCDRPHWHFVWRHHHA